MFGRVLGLSARRFCQGSISERVGAAAGVAANGKRWCSTVPGLDEPLIVTQKDGVRRIVLNHNKKRNALSMNMMERLLNAIAGDPDSNEDLSSIVLSANGRVFSAGHDLAELKSLSPDRSHELFSLCSSLMMTIREIEVPVIAQVHGLATAAGCQLVASCDVAIAGENAKFATPGVNIGLFCSTPAVAVCRAVPTKQAMHMLLTGEPITAQEALQYGLVSKVVPEAELEEATTKLTDRLSSLSPTVIGFGKRIVYEQINCDLGKAYRLTSKAMAENAGFADCKEGLSAFLEKRTPQWGN